MPSPERRLIEINLNDIGDALGVRNCRWFRRTLAPAFLHPARLFARQLLRFDAATARVGLGEAARALAAVYIARLEARGVVSIPRSGPLLVVSNHPGMSDTLALFSTIPRDDLAVLALDRPVLGALPAVAARLIAVPPGSRGGTVRAAVEHLRAGGALLTFPAGTTEPDPALHPDARDGIGRWSRSTILFARLVAGLRIVPCVVSGVNARRAQRHPLTWIRRKPQDRQLVGSTLQILVKVLAPGSWPVQVTVRYGAPMRAEELAALDTLGALQRLRASVAALMPVAGR